MIILMLRMGSKKRKGKADDHDDEFSSKKRIKSKVILNLYY